MNWLDCHYRYTNINNNKNNVTLQKLSRKLICYVLTDTNFYVSLEFLKVKEKLKTI